MRKGQVRVRETDDGLIRSGRQRCLNSRPGYLCCRQIWRFASIGIGSSRRASTVARMGLDPLAYLREALAGPFTLGEKPTTERLVVGGAVAGRGVQPPGAGRAG